MYWWILGVIQIRKVAEKGVAWSTDCIREVSKTSWMLGGRIDRLKALGIPFAYDPTGDEPMLILPDPDSFALVDDGDLDSRLLGARGIRHVGIMVEIPGVGTQVLCYRADRDYSDVRFPPLRVRG